ncbi:hypothetical protein [Oceaniglobus trochenteri]|uniref:hypothetical protein n=1 Tax=Oceaniglobus trochenteri TaxID=2763260 RepID=UPI001CFFB39C|nr:hypothetical protein [Oceaniglobus trochenteri]
MDWSAIISEIGGGLPAVVIVALAWMNWQERKRNDELTRARFDDFRTHNDQMHANTQTLGRALDALEGRVRG